MPLGSPHFWIDAGKDTTSKPADRITPVLASFRLHEPFSIAPPYMYLGSVPDNPHKWDVIKKNQSSLALAIRIRNLALAVSGKHPRFSISDLMTTFFFSDLVSHRDQEKD